MVGGSHVLDFDILGQFVIVVWICMGILFVVILVWLGIVSYNFIIYFFMYGVGEFVDIWELEI